jgi:hypothetical protein
MHKNSDLKEGSKDITWKTLEHMTGKCSNES